MGAWTEQLDRRAAVIIEQMMAARTLAAEFGCDPEAGTARYRTMLRDLYAQHLPYAVLLDDSDLVARFEGRAVDVDAPAVRIVTGAFSTLRMHVHKLAKAIAGLGDQPGKPIDGLDLGLSGIARGSLVVGVRVRPMDTVAGETLSLLGEHDGLYVAVRKAVRALAIVSQHVDEDAVSPALAEDVSDPAVRDSLLVAASHIAPSGWKGEIDAITLVAPNGKETHPPKPLTPRSRKVLRAAIEQPVTSQRRADFVGIVREIDLDARRFEIRGLEGGRAVRCVYPESMSREARSWLDQRVQVAGRCEFAANGMPRLMEIDSIKSLPRPDGPQGQIMMFKP